MENTDKKTIDLPIVLKIDAQAAESLIDFMLNWPDIFGEYIGYWAYGIRLNKGPAADLAEGNGEGVDGVEPDGWLVVECEDMDVPPGKKSRQAIIDHYRQTGERHFKKTFTYKRDENGETKLMEWTFEVHRLDREAAMEVIKAGIQNEGTTFLENYDASSLDAAIQVALLGKLVYA